MKDEPRRLDLKAWAILLGAVVVAVFVTAAFFAQYPWDFPGLVRGLILLVISSSVVLFAVALVLGAIAVVRGMAFTPRREREAEVDAVEIARRRYARGEIDREEFLRLRDDLHPGGTEPSR